MSAPLEPGRLLVPLGSPVAGADWFGRPYPPAGDARAAHPHLPHISPTSPHISPHLPAWQGMPVLLAPAAAEIFGGSHSGEIYRRLWLTVPLANFVGTSVMARARDSAYERHAATLAGNIDDAQFAATFGADKAELASLVHSKAVTLPMLLKLSPEGTADPSPFLYNDVFYGLAGCSALALACNLAAFRIPVVGRSRRS